MTPKVEQTSYWKWSIREGTFGHVSYPDSTRTRWVCWDAPWTEDVRLYDCPQRFNYYGRKWIWHFGAQSQRWDKTTGMFMDWKRPDAWRRFVIYPANHSERSRKEFPK